MTTPPRELVDALLSGRNFLVTSHQNPDGDAIGSGLATARILHSLGKSVTLWYRDSLPSVYQALPGSEVMHTGDQPPPGFPEAFDRTITLECPSLDRSGLEEHLAGREILNIDHHLGNDEYGIVNWIDTAAPSLGELLFHLTQAMELEIDEDTATCLYLTLVTDTGGFRFSNATARAFTAAAALVRQGARPERVSQWLYESQPISSLRLLAEMLPTIDLHGDGRVATALLTQEMFERAGAERGDSEGLIDYPRSIGGVQCVALLREIGDGEYKVSLRSRGEVDIETIASRHGGGGHRNAAGCTLRGPFEAVRKQISRELLDIL
ncbi:MAG: bifunctional oligoribonuclease/PAP phosphatase NrnA [Thermoanaerobaculia bacterium]|nr:bifunctional oligoribonuclease/PAP phosphatase NrnA [Thermoanaerobaculia bacterium]